MLCGPQINFKVKKPRLCYQVLGRFSRLEVDDESFHDQKNGLDVVLAGVVKNGGLKQRPRKLLHRHHFAAQRVELKKLRQEGFGILVDQGAPEILAEVLSNEGRGFETVEK